MLRRISILLISLLIALICLTAQSRAEQQNGLTPIAYLPMVSSGPDFACAVNSTHQYVSGPVFQYDQDNPVRPAHDHADKNIALRGYAVNSDPYLVRELIDYGSGDPIQPPQLATLFSPYRVPPFAGFYRVHHWNWSASPNPGTRNGVIEMPPTTAVGFTLSPGETLHVPVSGYDIGGGAEVIVLFADRDTVTLHYTREDSASVGYTLHLDGICTDPNLLALYQTLDDPHGPRYQFSSGASYELPTLSAGKLFGTTGTQEMVVAIVDTGAYQDPRSCHEWWQIKPGYVQPCPLWQGSQ